jgi:DNA polymerase III delta subunit
MKKTSTSSKQPATSARDAGNALKELLERPEVPFFILVTAPDLIRLRRVEDRCKERLSTKGMQLIRIRGDELTSDTITRLSDELATLSLFAGPKLYVLQYLDRAPAASIKLLAQLLSRSVPQTTVLALAAPLPASDPVAQVASEHGTYIRFPELSGPELAKWTAREASQAGIADCPASVIERIIELGEGRPDAIAEITTHLALYLDGAPATPATLLELFPSVATAGEFELIDAIAAGSVARAELLFDTLLRSGKSPFMLLGMISKIFGNYHLIATMLERRIPPNAIREELKMAPWVFNKSIEAAKRIQPRQIQEQLDAIARADSKLKNKSLGAESIFSALFHVLCPRPRERHA